MLASALAFAIGPVGATLAFEAGSNTPTVVALRGLVAAALMALLVVMLRQGFRLDGRAWPFTLACGALQGVAVYGFLGSVALVPVGVAVLVFFTHPLLLAGLAHVRGTERLSALQAVLMAAVLGGLSLLMGPELVGIHMGGVALAALSSIAMGGMILCVGRAHRYASSTQVNLYTTVISTLAISLGAIVFGAWVSPADRTGWLGVFAAGTGVGLSLLASIAALRQLSPVRASVLSSVEPLFSIVLPAAILDQALRPGQWAGAHVVVGALSVFEAAKRRTPRDGPKVGLLCCTEAKSEVGENPEES